MEFNINDDGGSSAQNIEDFKSSVATNGGFYIARYEASYGTDEKANSKISLYNSNSASELVEGKLWNYVTQPDASKACQNLYMEIKSDLINSYAWDTATLYIQKCSNNSKYSIDTSKNNVLSNTGTNEDESCKINDMSSNLGEWTTEYAYWNCAMAGSAQGRVCRGGRFSNLDYFTSFRGKKYLTSIDKFSVLATEQSEDKGFRAILYL